MHAHARLNAKAAGVILYYIPAIDMPACRMARSDFDDMRANMGYCKNPSMNNKS